MDGTPCSMELLTRERYSGNRRSTSPTKTIDLFVAETNDIDESTAERVDWASLEIKQGHEYDERDVPVEEDEMFTLLDITDEEVDQEEQVEVNLSTEKDDSPIRDVIEEEQHFSYDMDNPEI
ncbi:hypothetical protein GUJ93_ZPchr0006g41651 [Zizania palustris]|uniref:Uncharacterized protein n=1 Tax=Zizania palustris TaxID=103762 RepID=A0A8J5T771_ZIZPA|nr:hypothetical protein GUJ93_ZPchr0006g41651 [Zizania palustris]